MGKRYAGNFIFGGAREKSESRTFRTGRTCRTSRTRKIKRKMGENVPGTFNYFKAPRTQGPRNSRTQELKNIGQPKGEKQVCRYAGTQVCREKKN